MENCRSYIVDVIGNPQGVPGSGGYRDTNQRLTALYTNPRPYIETCQTQKVIVDNSACIRNEVKAQLIGFGLELAFDGIRYLWHKPEVQHTVNQGLTKIGDFIFGTPEIKAVKTQRKFDMYENERNIVKYDYSREQGYGSWREIGKEKPRTSETPALPQKQSAYQGIENKNDMVVISRAEYEALKRQDKIVVLKQKNNMGGQKNDSI